MVKPTTVRLEPALTRGLDALAAATDRPRAWHLEQAVRRYLAEEAWQVEAIQAALAAGRAGGEDLAPHEEVMGRLEARIRAAAADELSGSS